MITVLAVSVFAQSVQGGWQSPQSIATQGRMRSTADNFIRPDAYAGAGIKDWFAMSAFRGGANSTFSTNLGYAKNMENLYIGVYYGGNFWGGLVNHSFTETYVDWAGSEAGTLKQVPVYSGIGFATSPRNVLAVLIGVADMGFRISVDSTYQGFSGSDIQVAGTDYKSYEAGNGNIFPQLAWSMTKNLTPNGIRPYAMLDLRFANNFLKTEAATIGTSAGEQIARSQNTLTPVFEIGLGGYNLANLNGFRVSADADYTLTLVMYNNEYSYLNTDGKYVTEKIKGLNTNGVFTENSSMTNRFRPSIAGQWSNENFAFRTRLRMAISYQSTTVTQMTLNAENKLEKNGTETETGTFLFNPHLELAMQWRIVPKLALNAGGYIDFGNLGTVTTEVQPYANGTATENTATKQVSYTLGSPTNTLTLGVTLNPTNYLTFEASSGVSTGNSVSVFSDTGLFNFTNILVSFRF